MATYAFSDVHGHAATLDRLLNRVAPADEDHVYMLGDMIDRGPDPVGVLRLCRNLTEHGGCVLMGNHEDLMLNYLEVPDDPLNLINWQGNGGETTRDGLAALPEHECIDLLNWIGELPLFAYEFVGSRPYVMTHAGIRPHVPFDRALEPRAAGWSEDDLMAMLEAQAPEDLLWIRDDFWGVPTDLLDMSGEGPVVVAGHTPTAYLEGMADRPNRRPVGEDGLCRMVEVGACSATGDVADRIDIDCGAAGGSGFGQLLMLRLDDMQEFYEPVLEGE